MNEAQFEAWPKIPRHGKGGVVITEKIDGTNAQINIVRVDYLLHTGLEPKVIHTFIDEDDEGWAVFAGSRKRYITPEEDNFGFARWVEENRAELIKLGEGRHFGEWYGAGIQRGYGLDHKRFALFNTSRWGDHNPNTPECCEAVPILYAGDYRDNLVASVMENLKVTGSHAATGFDNPEGIIVYNTTYRSFEKATYDYKGGKWADK